MSEIDGSLLERVELLMETIGKAICVLKRRILLCHDPMLLGYLEVHYSLLLSIAQVAASIHEYLGGFYPV